MSHIGSYYFIYILAFIITFILNKINKVHKNVIFYIICVKVNLHRRENKFFFILQLNTYGIICMTHFYLSSSFSQGLFAGGTERYAMLETFTRPILLKDIFLYSLLSVLNLTDVQNFEKNKILD